MKEFEYMSLDARSSLSAGEMNFYGKEGWELVSALPDHLVPTLIGYVFKREIVYSRVFENKVVYREVFTTLSVSDLKELSLEGWRLICVSEIQTLVRYFFEREIRGAREN